MSARGQRQKSPIEEQIKNEFRSYWNSAEKSRLTDLTKQRAVIASAHKYAMCFWLMSRAMASSRPLEHQRIFFQEMSSDAIHLVHTLIGGDARGGRFYLRSVIENFWRHHYFRDHPVEYEWLHSRDKYFLEMKNLRDHCGWLNCFQGKMGGLLTNLPRLYGELSTSVHSTSSRTVVLREALTDIKLQDGQTAGISKDILAVLKVCLALCIFSEIDIFQGLHVNVQQCLMNSLSASQSAIVRDAITRAGLQNQV